MQGRRNALGQSSTTYHSVPPTDSLEKRGAEKHRNAPGRLRDHELKIGGLPVPPHKTGCTFNTVSPDGTTFDFWSNQTLLRIHHPSTSNAPEFGRSTCAYPGRRARPRLTSHERYLPMGGEVLTQDAAIDTFHREPKQPTLQNGQDQNADHCKIVAACSMLRHRHCPCNRAHVNSVGLFPTLPF